MIEREHGFGILATRADRRAFAIAATCTLAVACGGAESTSSKTTAPITDTCRVQLPPRRVALDPESPAPASRGIRRSSRLVANVEIGLPSLAKELEAKTATRLAEEHDKNIGFAGSLSYTVDRGPFRIAVENDALVIRTDVRARAQACRGAQCYASCEPVGVATATVPLRLTPEYRFAPSRVTFAFTRGCEVRALGGMVKIDVTPTIQSEIAPALRRVEREIDGKLPPLRPQAERLWAELGKTRKIPLGGCIVTNPSGLVEGPVTGTSDALRVRFGVIAHPEIRARCDEADAVGTTPLPPLQQDPSLPEEDDLVLALVSPLSSLAASLEAAEPFDAGGARARIARAVATPAGSHAALDLGLRGEACGDLAVRAALAWTEDGRHLRLASPTLSDHERERMASLSPETFTRSLSALRLAPPMSPEALAELVPALASSLSDPSVEVSAKVSGVRPLGVSLRGGDLAASVALRGSVDVKQR